MHGKPYALQAFELAWHFRKTGDVLPTWFITDKTGFTEIIGTAWANDETKYDATALIADIVRERKAIRVMFITDAWMRDLPANAPISERNKRPSQSVDSFEAITLQLWCSDKTGYFKMRAYRQNDKGELEILWEKENNDWGAMDYSQGPIQTVIDALVSNEVS